MFRKLVLGALGLGFVLAEVASCSIDSREFSVVLRATPGGPDASAPGEGAGDPVLGVEPTSVSLGQAVVGSPSRGRVTVVNAGTSPLLPAQAAILMDGDPDFIVLHDQCSSPLAPSERCDVRIQLVPSEPGAQSATLGIDASGQSAQVPLGAEGVTAGPLIVAPAAGSSGDFGGVVLGSSVQAFFDVSNPLPDASGPLNVTLNEPQFELLPPAAGECEVGVTTLANGESCRLHVGFTPARRGATDALLVVTSPSLGSSSLPLTGAGRLAPVLAAPDLVNFGNVVLGGAGRRTLRVDNRGDEPLALSEVALMDAAAPDGAAGSGSPFSVQNSDCGGGKVLPGGGSCSITLAFRPLLAQPNQQTQLNLSGADGARKGITLSGGGLNEGTLRIAAAADSSGDYGGLAIGASSTQVFTVSNPSQQPTGGLEIASFDDFTLVPPAGDADCQPGITSLAGDQSCSITVTFAPSSSGEHDGALTVASALAGAVHLPLTGRGLAPARLALASDQVDFGRVPTETAIQQVVTVQNGGELPISGLSATLVGAAGAPVAGFTIASPCAAELGVGATCDIGIQFLPSDAATYSAVLQLTSPSATNSLLLLGRAFPRGNLQLTPLEGSGDFGDVVLGMPRTQRFTLTNNGSSASGRLTITSTTNLLTLDPGDCNVEGLESGASCTLGVTFTPTTSDPVVGNLSIQSPGAGETALSLRGRGRAAANLTATNNRDLGRANVGQAEIREPENQFTWTVTNEGDMDSGVLAVTSTDAESFVISNDTCSDAVVPGRGSCTMDIRFLPTAVGALATTLTVTDTVSAQALTLALTGTGVVIAQPGQSCVNGEECATGVCTGSVCCDRECISSCQVCSAAGVCVDQAERQECGNGNGQCFGVERCLLPETQPCTGDDQCGSGQCEPRIGGVGRADRICCLDDCGTTGQQCNPETGRCQVPELGNGAACGAAGQPECGAGLECKECRGGGSECTPAAACCGGCDPGYVCSNGECGCPPDAVGRAQIDCGNGVCIQNRANACCASAPECPANLPECDANVGLCRQCLQASDCPAGPANTVASCNNFTCSYACNTFGGFKDCGGNRCVQNTQCCGNQDCANCQTCGANGFCGGGCNGAQVCGANNVCATPGPVGLGQQCNQQARNCTAQPGLSCGTNNICQCTGNGFRQCGNTCSQVQCCNDSDCSVLSGGVCSGGRCGCPNGQTQCGASCVDTGSDSRNCGGCNQVCNSNNGLGEVSDCNGGSCDCGSTRAYSPLLNACASEEFNLCSQNSDCLSNRCVLFFVDNDGDGFGASAIFMECWDGVNAHPIGVVPQGGDMDDSDPTR